MSEQGTTGAFFCKGIHVCGIGSLDGIALHALLRGDTPAIVDAVEGVNKPAREPRRGHAHETDLVLDLDHGGDEDETESVCLYLS